MSVDTAIEWCDSSGNPSMGCEGCELWTPTTKLCYAGLLHEQRPGHKGYAAKFEEPEMFPERMDNMVKWTDLSGKHRMGSKKVGAKPWLLAMPRTIFLGDMGDLFSKSIPDEFITDVMQKATKAKQHIWIVLTKRPSRMAKLVHMKRTSGGAEGSCDAPENIWGMTSVTNRKSLPRIEWLKKTNFYVKGLSVEPLLEDLPELPNMLDGLDWVVIGGLSGNVKHEGRTRLEWILRIVTACRQRQIPVFVKQIGSGHPDQGHANLKGSDWLHWPEEIHYRQMPLHKTKFPDNWNYHPKDFYAYENDMFDERSPNVLTRGDSIPH